MDNNESYDQEPKQQDLSPSSSLESPEIVVVSLDKNENLNQDANQPEQPDAPSPTLTFSPDPTILAPPEQGKGLAIAGMVLGIISVALACAPYLTFPCAIVAIILSGISLSRKAPGRQMAIAGLVCGIVGAVIGIVIILCIVLGIISSLHTNINEIHNSL